MNSEPPPPPRGGAEFLEAPKAPKKISDWPKARTQIWAGVGGWVQREGPQGVLSW